MSDRIATALHNYQPGHDKFYVCRIDDVGGANPYRVVSAWGPITRAKAQAEHTEAEFNLIENASWKMDQVIQKKKKKGYVDVATSAYSGSYSEASILKKVDMTRCCYVDRRRSVNVSPPPAKATKTTSASAASLASASRRRNIIRLKDRK